MKLNHKILKLARHEVDHHLMQDLFFTGELHRFMNDTLDVSGYMNSPFGFKKFINDYGIGRTLQGGDAAKIKILNIIKTFPFGNAHVDSISLLAHRIKEKKLSSKSGTGGHGLPQSFASKFLYVYKPDEIIPFDSYVLKSLSIRNGRPPKELDQYYEKANQFRLEFFPETGAEVRNIRKNHDPQAYAMINALQLDPDKLLSWKLTDKYLWCEHEVRRSIDTLRR
jgi:hypothetical protein